MNLGILFEGVYLFSRILGYLIRMKFSTLANIIDPMNILFSWLGLLSPKSSSDHSF